MASLTLSPKESAASLARSNASSNVLFAAFETYEGVRLCPITPVQTMSVQAKMSKCETYLAQFVL